MENNKSKRVIKNKVKVKVGDIVLFKYLNNNNEGISDNPMVVASTDTNTTIVTLIEVKSIDLVLSFRGKKWDSIQEMLCYFNALNDKEFVIQEYCSLCIESISTLGGKIAQKSIVGYMDEMGVIKAIQAFPMFRDKNSFYNNELIFPEIKTID